MMKLGLVSAILPDDSFEQVIDYAAQVGFSCVEVCCWPKGKAIRRYAGITHIDMSECDDAKLLYYKKYAEDRGVAISSLGYYPNPMDANQEAADVAIKHIYRLIDASAVMGVNMVTTFIGRDKNKTVEENLDKFEVVWAPIVAYAEKKGVKIAIENCPMLYTVNEWPGGNNLACSPAIWREMFRRIPSPALGLNFDPSHPYLIGASYTKPLYEFKDRIYHVHFKDIKLFPEKLHEFGVMAYPLDFMSPKLPGLGDVDWGKYVSALTDIGYDGYTCIEVEDKAFEGSKERILDSLRLSKRYMEQFVI